MNREGAVTDQMCQKWFAKFCAGDFLLGDAPRLGRPVEVDSDQSQTSRTLDGQHTQNIQSNKVIGENEKCIFSFTEKTIQTFWPNQY